MVYGDIPRPLSDTFKKHITEAVNRMVMDQPNLIIESAEEEALFNRKVAARYLKLAPIMPSGNEPIYNIVSSQHLAGLQYYISTCGDQDLMFDLIPGNFLI